MHRQIFLSALGKTILWIFIHSFFGLSPILITILLSSFTPEIHLSIPKIIEEGLILFFCSTISAVAMLDFIFAKIRFPKYIEFGLYFCPSFILLISGTIFGQLYFHHKETYNLINLLHWQNSLIAISIIYCFVLKVLIFINED